MAVAGFVLFSPGRLSNKHDSLFKLPMSYAVIISCNGDYISTEYFMSQKEAEEFANLINSLQRSNHLLEQKL
jgi:hypothetical protein